MTLVCNTPTPGTYRVTIVDSTPADDFPRNAEPLAVTGSSGAGFTRSTIVFTLHVTTESVTANDGIVAQKSGATAPGVAYLRVDTGRKSNISVLISVTAVILKSVIRLLEGVARYMRRETVLKVSTKVLIKT